MNATHQSSFNTDQAGLEAIKAEIEKAIGSPIPVKEKKHRMSMAEREEAIQKAMNAWPEWRKFTPVEKLFPDWPEAREVISAYLPDKIRVEVHFHIVDTIQIYSAWIEDIVEEAPRNVVMSIYERLQLSLETIWKCFPAEEVKAVINGQISENSARHINEIIDKTNDAAILNGEPSLIDILKHVMGIKESHLLNARLIKYLQEKYGAG